MNRIACVWVPHFMAEIEVQRRTEADASISARPLIVCDDRRVLDACSQAFADGVRPGDSLSQALGRCPRAHVVEPDRTHYARVWEGILETLALHTPSVEEEAMGVAYLEARGMGNLYGDEDRWCQAMREAIWDGTHLPAQIGVARAKFAAWMAARTCSPDQSYHAVSGRDRAYLGPLPLDELPLSNEARRRLGLLGIRTMGQLARLPTASAAEQLGPENLQAHRWARGDDDRSLSPRRRQTMEVCCDYEVAETRLGPLVEAMLIKSEGAVAKIHRECLTIQRLTMDVGFDNGAEETRTAWVGGPLDQETLRTTLENLLAKLDDVASGVLEMRLEMIGLAPGRGRQLDLFAHAEAQIRMEESLKRLAKRYAPGAVCHAIVGDPYAPLLAERYAFEEIAP